MSQEMTDEEWRNSIEWIRLVGACVIKKDGKYLMVQESQDKAYGLWNVPAGHVDKGETVEACAVREAKEESGYDVELGEQLGLYHENGQAALKHVFEARVIGGEATPQEGEIMDVQWLTFEEVKALYDEGKFRFEWAWDAIRKYEAANSGK